MGVNISSGKSTKYIMPSDIVQHQNATPSEWVDGDTLTHDSFYVLADGYINFEMYTEWEQYEQNSTPDTIEMKVLFNGVVAIQKNYYTSGVYPEVGTNSIVAEGVLIDSTTLVEVVVRSAVSGRARVRVTDYKVKFSPTTKKVVL